MGLCQVGGLQGVVDLAGFIVGDGEGHLLGVAKLTKVDLEQGVGVGEVVVLLTGAAVAEVGVVADIGVVGQDIGGIQAVGAQIVTVKDLGSGPVAVEADHGHGQTGSGSVLGVHTDLVGVDVALDIDAVGELVQISLVGIGQNDLAGDLDSLTGGDGDLVGGSGDAGSQIHIDTQLSDIVGDDHGIEGIDLAVGVDIQVAVVDIVLGDQQLAGHELHQHTGISGGDGTVVIEVVAQDTVCTSSFESNLGLQSVGSVADEVVGNDGLRQHAAGQGEGSVGVGLVGQLEGELVDTGSGIVITELDLGTALGGGGVAQIALSGGGVDQVNEACTLVSGGVLQTAGVEDGGSGGHHDVGGDSALLSTRQLGVGFLDVLQQDCHSTGNLGRSHGGTAHVAVVGAGQGGISGGVDVAANAGDLGLQLQIGGDAPGGEAGHGGVDLEDLGIGVADGQSLVFGSGQCLAGSLGNGNTGDGAVAVIDLHQEHTGGIVVDDAADGALLLGHGLLLGEGGGAAGDDGDLTGDIEALVILLSADAGDHHILQSLTHEVVDEHGALVGGGVAEAVVHAVDGEVEHHFAVVVGGGHVQSGGVGGGSTGQTDIGVQNQGHIAAPQVHEGVVGVITGGDDDLDLGLEEQVHGVQHITGGIGEAGGCAQGQVGGIHIQADAVLQGGHDGGPVGTAAALEHLHDDQLGIGSHTDDIGALNGVGGDDTGNVGAVVGAGEGVVHIKIAPLVVEGEGDLVALVADIQQIGALGGVQGVPDLLNALTGHGIEKLALIHGLEGGVSLQNTGIQDGDAHALTGEAGVVQHISADHGGGVAGHGGQLLLAHVLGQSEGGSHVDLLDAGQSFQLGLVGVGSLHGEAGGTDGVGVAELHVLAQDALGICLDGVQRRLLGGLVGVDGNGLSGDVTGGEFLQQGSILGDHDEGHVLVGGVQLVLLGLGEGGVTLGFQLGQLTLGDGLHQSGLGKAGLDGFHGSGSAAQAHGTGQGQGLSGVGGDQGAVLHGCGGDAGLDCQSIGRQHGHDHHDGQDQGKNLFVHSVTSLIQSCWDSSR